MPNVHTDTHVSIRSTDYLTGMCSTSPNPDGFREPRYANPNLLLSAGKFTKQLPDTIITASTIKSQYYKISVLYVPQISRKSVAGKHNLCRDLHIFCGLAVFPRDTYITVRRNVSEAS
jgi:cellulase/cellobiase CelA1